MLIIYGVLHCADGGRRLPTTAFHLQHRSIRRFIFSSYYAPSACHGWMLPTNGLDPWDDKAGTPAFGLSFGSASSWIHSVQRHPSSIYSQRRIAIPPAQGAIT
ncbi:unnamed protein product [Pylaiella littoralis]